MARLEARARVTLSRELVTAAKAHLSKAAKSQHTQLLRHLTAEATRIKAELGGSGTGAVPLPLLGGGLMPGDVAKLKGEWKVAIEKHLATF
jgi:hypothetical protein